MYINEKLEGNIMKKEIKEKDKEERSCLNRNLLKKLLCRTSQSWRKHDAMYQSV